MGPDNLADRLGVDESELRDALDDFHRPLPEPGDLRDDFAESLAKELGIDQEKVEAALERVRENAEREFQQRHDELAQQLADRFNLDVDEVEEALDGFPFFGHVRPVRPPGP
jgi:energy-converting hydrogenase A subunit M